MARPGVAWDDLDGLAALSEYHAPLLCALPHYVCCSIVQRHIPAGQFAVIAPGTRTLTPTAPTVLYSARCYHAQWPGTQSQRSHPSVAHLSAVLLSGLYTYTYMLRSAFCSAARTIPRQWHATHRHHSTETRPALRFRPHSSLALPLSGSLLSTHHTQYCVQITVHGQKHHPRGRPPDTAVGQSAGQPHSQSHAGLTQYTVLLRHRAAMHTIDEHTTVYTFCSLQSVFISRCTLVPPLGQMIPSIAAGTLLTPDTTV